MLALARAALNNAVTGLPAQIGSKELSVRLLEKRGCFVTLTKHGALRGCVGQFATGLPLHEAIARYARQAALEDPRFPPVQSAELDSLRIEISVLTEPQPLSFGSPQELLEKLGTGGHGVLLQIGERTATFLPQVWAQVPHKEDFLERLALKAGLPPSAWRRGDAIISLFRAESFAEDENRICAS